MTRVYYGWIVLLLAAAAMVGTLPGRTQGLGLVTEPLIADLAISRVDYAQLNLWATLDRIRVCDRHRPFHRSLWRACRAHGGGLRRWERWCA